MKIPKTIPICGIEHELVFVGPKRMEFVSGDSESLGCVDVDHPRIFLAKRLKKTPTLLRDTIVHEAMGHALWLASGLAWWLKGQTKHKRDTKAFYDFQEVLIRWHTPVSITTLISVLKALREKGLGL